MKALYQAPSAELRRLWATAAARMAEGQAPAMATTMHASDRLRNPMERHAEQAALAEVLQQMLQNA